MVYYTKIRNTMTKTRQQKQNSKKQDREVITDNTQGGHNIWEHYYSQ